MEYVNESYIAVRQSYIGMSLLFITQSFIYIYIYSILVSGQGSRYCCHSFAIHRSVSVLQLYTHTHIYIYIYKTILVSGQGCRFGTNCIYECHCKDGQTCNQETGVCPRGCDDGVLGTPHGYRGEWSGYGCQIGNCTAILFIVGCKLEHFINRTSCNTTKCLVFAFNMNWVHFLLHRWLFGWQI